MWCKPSQTSDWSELSSLCPSCHVQDWDDSFCFLAHMLAQLHVLSIFSGTVMCCAFHKLLTLNLSVCQVICLGAWQRGRGHWDSNQSGAFIVLRQPSVSPHLEPWMRWFYCNQWRKASKYLTGYLEARPLPWCHRPLWMGDCSLCFGL